MVSCFYFMQLPHIPCMCQPVPWKESHAEHGTARFRVCDLRRRCTRLGSGDPPCWYWRCHGRRLYLIDQIKTWSFCVCTNRSSCLVVGFLLGRQDHVIAIVVFERLGFCCPMQLHQRFAFFSIIQQLVACPTNIYQHGVSDTLLIQWIIGSWLGLVMTDRRPGSTWPPWLRVPPPWPWRQQQTMPQLSISR